MERPCIVASITGGGLMSFYTPVLAFYPADIIYSFIETPGARNIENSIVNASSITYIIVLKRELNVQRVD